MLVRFDRQKMKELVSSEEQENSGLNPQVKVNGSAVTNMDWTKIKQWRALRAKLSLLESGNSQQNPNVMNEGSSERNTD